MNKRIMSLMLAAVLIFTSVSFVFADSTYTVKSGDVLWKIAQKNNTTWQQLAEINKLKNPNLIFPSQVLKLQVDANTSASASQNTPDKTPAAPVVSGPDAAAKGKLSFKAGTYTGEARGIGGPVKIEVKVDDTSIISVKVLVHNETKGIGTNAVEQLPATIVKTQSLGVDTIAGCTVSSKAIIEGVKSALSTSGVDMKVLFSKPAASQNTNAVQDATTDVVVVGGGGAGMSAAIEAKSQGLNVILIEKLPIMGGTTALASTAFNAGGSSIQLSSDKPYTADDYYKKLLGSKKEDDLSLRRLADLSGKTADWLVGMGADLSRIINGSQHCPEDGGAIGAMLVPKLLDKMDALKIDYRTNSKGTKIIMDGDKAVGVEVESKDGSYKIHAKAVILATGGFASNPEMVAKYTPQWAGYPSTASVGATGDGINMALQVGAGLGNMNVTSPQTVAYDTGHGAVSLTNVRYNGAILVNKESKRFVNELANTEVLGTKIKEQTGGYAYLIFDQKAVDRAALMQEYKDHGYFTEADTLEALSDKLGLNGAALTETVKTYQKYYDAGKDEEFGRKDSMFSRIDTPKYYGAKISPASQITNGGVLIDSGARALREDGTVIKGLYIGGETASQLGHGLTVAFVIGRLAGQTAADDIQ